MTKRQEAMTWWNDLSSPQKTRLCDLNTEILCGHRRWESLTGIEIEVLYRLNKEPMTVEEFISTFYKDVLPYEPRYIRPGQALMNYLSVHRRDLYNAVTGHGDWDCFYDDKNIGNLIAFLYENWIITL